MRGPDVADLVPPPLPTPGFGVPVNVEESGTYVGDYPYVERSRRRYTVRNGPRSVDLALECCSVSVSTVVGTSCLPLWLRVFLIT